jgi:hypothetical protein
MFDSIDFHIDSAEKFLYEYANLFRVNPQSTLDSLGMNKKELPT